MRINGKKSMLRAVIHPRRCQFPGGPWGVSLLCLRDHNRSLQVLCFHCLACGASLSFSRAENVFDVESEVVVAGLA